MITLYLNGVGLRAPGLIDWQGGVAILRGDDPYSYQELPSFRSSLLPANERRRITRVIGLTLQVAQEAVAQAGIEAKRICSVFASSDGDSEISDKICTALSLPEKPVSPTDFHNSVHNAPAGYWTIATGCSMPSISLAAYDDSFSAGLLEAAALARVEQACVLLVGYDYPPSFPLAEQRKLLAPFATALLLSPERRKQTCAKLTLKLISQATEDRLDQEDLERLRTANPAARSLPLLKAVASGGAGRVILAYSADSSLQIELES